MRTNQPIIRFSFYVLFITCLALLVLFGSATQIPVSSVMTLGLFVLGTAVAESLAVSVRGESTMSVSYPLSVAATLTLGPTAGGIVAACSGVSLSDLRCRKSPTKLAFNVSQLILSATASGWLYLLAGGRVLDRSGIRIDDFPAMLLPLAILAFSSFSLNTLMVSIAVAILESGSPRRVWTETYAWMLPGQFALALTGFMISEVLNVVGLVGLFLFAVPLLISRQMYHSYVALRDAYTDTIRSLVTVIEAKDSYTRGHSERVATYALEIAKAMGYSVRKMERLEIAALLHDLGKLGISTAVLTKPGGLTAEEYTEIKRHPSLGASIIESVAFLSDVVPVVLFHHERFDGTGYEHGLKGETIPLEARILAVADSYDAMTSKRAYRDALSHDWAMSELLQYSGTQFDPACVKAFAAAQEGKDAACKAGPSQEGNAA